jgi:hypothetical protein
MEKLFKKLSASDVYLDEEHHIYISTKDEKTFFNSVTGSLELIKPKFDDRGALEGLGKQYANFYKWYFNERNYHMDNFVESLYLWVNYKEFRDPTGEGHNWETGKKYLTYPKLAEYPTLDSLILKLKFLQFKHQLSKYKNIYISPENKIFTSGEMKGMWKMMTDIANHYGNIVHITNERYIWIKQNMLKDDVFLPVIINHYTEMYKLLKLTRVLYPHSLHSFEIYYINQDKSGNLNTLHEFVKYLENEFSKVKFDWGRCIVSEKRLIYTKPNSNLPLGLRTLTGTMDVYVDIDETTFDVGDHKTNKEYTFKSNYGQKLIGNGLLTLPQFEKYNVFSEYDACEHELYTLQLNIYAFMIEKSSLKKNRDYWITYFNRKTMKYEKIIVPDRIDKAESLIEFYFDWMAWINERYSGSSLGPTIDNLIPTHWRGHFMKHFHNMIDREVQYANLTHYDNGANYSPSHIVTLSTMEKRKNQERYTKWIQKYVQVHKNIKIQK